MRVVRLEAENVKRLRITKRCPGCNIDKPLVEFYSSRDKRLGVATYCKPCAIEKAAVAYQRRKAAPKTLPAHKICGTCQLDLPRAGYWRSPSSRDGLMPECKSCRRDRVRAARYGLPPGEYDRLLDEQDGACAACARDDQALVVDHHHEDGVVRGLLCAQCNTAIGLMGDDVERVFAVAGYLLSTTQGAWA